MTRGKGSRSGWLVVVFALLLATAGATTAGAGSGASDFGADGGNSAGVTDAAQREPPEGNNSSISHRNPKEVSGEENLDDVEVWLVREMSGRLAESVNLSQSDRDRARELIGNDSEYERLAEQYREVQSQQAGNSSDEATPLRAGQLQREFFAEVELYRQIHEAYREARENNETVRTRRLAHALERQATEVNRTAVRLNESYANMSVEESQIRNATRTIGDLRANVTQTQLTVRDQTLVRTELSIGTDVRSGSFTDPIPLVGRLRTADGDPVANENVTLLVGNRTLNTTTDGTGRFQVAYRPTLAGAGERPRTIEFRPANESVYLRDDTTAEFEIRRVEPNVTVSNRSATVRYNDTLVVNGTVAADGVGVPDVPLSVTVDGVRIAQVRTQADGSFGAAKRLPGNVSVGDRRVNVSLALENATARADGPVALAPSNGSAQISVEETATTLSIADVQTYNGTAFVTGQLTTEDGEPLGNRTVELRIGGRTVGTAVTNGTGGYATTVTVRRGLLAGDSSVEVVAAYSPTDGNLAPARANATAALGASEIISGDQLRVGAAGLLGITVLAAFLWRSRSNEADAPDGNARETADRTRDEQASATSATRGRQAEELLDSATKALDDGAFALAAVAAYAAVRRRIERDGRGVEQEDRGIGRDERGIEQGDRVGTAVDFAPRTHWEFYDACRDAGFSDAELGQLESLTETYERAAFAPESVSEDDAREAVALAESFRPEDVTPEGEGPETAERETEPSESASEFPTT